MSAASLHAIQSAFFDGDGDNDDDPPAPRTPDGGSDGYDTVDEDIRRGTSPPPPPPPRVPRGTLLQRVDALALEHPAVMATAEPDSCIVCSEWTRCVALPCGHTQICLACTRAIVVEAHGVAEATFCVVCCVPFSTVTYAPPT